MVPLGGRTLANWDTFGPGQNNLFTPPLSFPFRPNQSLGDDPRTAPGAGEGDVVAPCLRSGTGSGPVVQARLGTDATPWDWEV